MTYEKTPCVNNCPQYKETARNRPIMTKKYFVENRETWKKEYGTLFNHLPGIVSSLRYIHNFIKLDEKPLRIVDYGCAYGYNICRF